jgi:preprotein translocase subunit Sec63
MSATSPKKTKEEKRERERERERVEKKKINYVTRNIFYRLNFGWVFVGILLCCDA